ncbi:MAG: XdhC family protein [Oscillospiraceae bacterium]|nr:XdhC family protein [Oscillospiraceae bacterium]
MKPYELMQEQADSLKAGRDFAVVTIVESEDLARTSGKMLVYADGSISGTVGGGMWEHAAIHDALECLKTGKNAVKNYRFHNEHAKLGYQCDGAMTAFIEVCRNDALQLVVVGGGHVGNAVIHAARAVGFSVTLVDTRSEAEIGDSIHAADRFVSLKSFSDVATASLPRDPYYVVSTYGHLVDGAALGGILTRGDARYIGMLGGYKKIHGIFGKLQEQGFTPEQLAAVHSPIGLDLGGETPAELAVAIIGEILAVKNGRNGGFLKKS